MLCFEARSFDGRNHLLVRILRAEKSVFHCGCRRGLAFHHLPIGIKRGTYSCAGIVRRGRNIDLTKRPLFFDQPGCGAVERHAACIAEHLSRTQLVKLRRQREDDAVVVILQGRSDVGVSRLYFFALVTRLAETTLKLLKAVESKLHDLGIDLKAASIEMQKRLEIAPSFFRVAVAG